MSTNLYLNNQNFNIDLLTLPLLINGKEGSGASFFSVSLIADLILSGKKAVFFTLAKPAFDQLKEQMVGKSYFHLDRVDDLKKSLSSDVVVIENGNIELCNAVVSQISDRVIFVKNVEETLSLDLLESVKNCKELILSGNFESSSIMEEILKIPYSDMISFGKFLNYDGDWSSLEHRKAYLFQEGSNKGIICCC